MAVLFMIIFVAGCKDDHLSGGNDLDPPFVTETDPADHATRGSLSQEVTATFNEAMAPSTISTSSFTLSNTGGSQVAGVVSYSASNLTAAFKANEQLAFNTTYTATITTVAENVAGNALENNHVWSFTTAEPSVQEAVVLGSAAHFAVLSHSAITSIPTSAITGDVGISPGIRTEISGLTDQEVTGTIIASDDSDMAAEMLIEAKEDARVAFVDAQQAVRGTPVSVSGNLNGLTLVPGLYESGSSIEISPGGFLYLDAGGDENAVFIIRSETSITTESTSEVVLQGSARAENIYWVAGSTITLGTNSKMKGTLLSGTSITLLTGARLDGRALIQGPEAGQIVLDANVIVLP
ncbi:MAG: ice-binding family protein [Balneolales bacterium]